MNDAATYGLSWPRIWRAFGRLLSERRWLYPQARGAKLKAYGPATAAKTLRRFHSPRWARNLRRAASSTEGWERGAQPQDLHHRPRSPHCWCRGYWCRP